MRFNERSKGVISVFLLITFSITFVFAGLLVDGGRVRMAKTLAESSLDNAASSALSYYDELLFDLYGLFAVEDPDTKKIQTRMDQYFKQTLALVPGDHTELQKILNNRISDYFDGYDFQVDSIKSGSGLNLGQVYVTESQIIEHMKYRAPLQLINQNYGFLQNVEGLVQMKDRLFAAKEKNSITKSYKATIESGGDLINDINDFGERCKKFAANPFGNGKSIDDVVLEYNNNMERNFKAYCENLKQQKIAYENGDTVEYEALKQDNGDIVKERDNLVQEWETIWVTFETDINRFYQENNDLKKRVDTYVDAMERYIKELEAKRNAGATEDYKTVFDPQIELSKATVGEVIMNKGVLLQAKLYLNVSQLSQEQFLIDTKLILENKYDDAESNDGVASWGSNFFKQKIDNLQYKKDIEEKIKRLKESCEDYSYAEVQTKSATYKPDTSEVKKLSEEKKGQDDMKSISADLLTGAIYDGPAPTGDSSDPDDVYGSGDDAADQAFDKGITLLTNLTDLLERGRDTLYIDEYILANFRNYVHHSAMDSSKAGKKEGNVTYDYIIADQFLKNDTKRYMVGEVEYILAGNTNQYVNVGFVSSEILLVRTAFNMAAMFTDTSMYQQANTLVAGTGPFAPLAAFALMVAWAVAESAIDTVAIMSGQKVLLFKQGKDWTLSMQGVIEKVAGVAFDATANMLEGVAAEYYNQFENKYNAAIYDFYVENENLQTNLTEVSQQIQQFPGGSSSDLIEGVGTIINETNSGLNAANEYVGMFDQKKDEAIAKLSETYKEKKNALKDTVVATAGNFPDPDIAHNTGSSAVEDAFKVELGYTDYLRILLLLENSEKKMKRVQQVIQINMIKGEGQSDFKMTNAYVNVWADATVSIKYLFMTEAIVPLDLRKDGRYQFQVHTNRSY